MSREKIANCERGLTLVEIIAVIILIGLIGTVVLRGVFGTSERAKAQLNVTKMEKVQAALAQYRLQYNSYPDKLEDLMHPSGAAKDSGQLFTAFADEEDLKDIWGEQYKYKSENSGRTYGLSSFGADRSPGGEGADQDVTKKP